MTLKTKLSIGLGFLFAIILLMAMFCSFYVGKMANEAENILKDNYDSLAYARNMLAALDDIRTAVNRYLAATVAQTHQAESEWLAVEIGDRAFMTNLNSESHNITEPQENDHVSRLRGEYTALMRLCNDIRSSHHDLQVFFDGFMPGYERTRQTINAIYEVNRQAVIRKSQLTQHDAANFITYMALIGAFCIILGFGYFWYFPFYTSNSLQYLAQRMTRVLNQAHIATAPAGQDELMILLRAIDTLEEHLAPATKEGT
jgi:hypothetical protein